MIDRDEEAQIQNKTKQINSNKALHNQLNRDNREVISKSTSGWNYCETETQPCSQRDTVTVRGRMSLTAVACFSIEIFIVAVVASLGSFILWAPTQEHLVPVRDRGRQRRENRADTNSTHHYVDCGLSGGAAISG